MQIPCECPRPSNVNVANSRPGAKVSDIRRPKLSRRQPPQANIPAAGHLRAELHAWWHELIEPKPTNPLDLLPFWTLVHSARGATGAAIRLPVNDLHPAKRRRNLSQSHAADAQCLGQEMGDIIVHMFLVLSHLPLNVIGRSASR